MLLSLLFACDAFRLPEDDWLGDLDGDGFDTWTDCDDFNPRVHPGAAEACNGVDNNCSGDESDAEDATPWFPDEDGDAWGDATAAVVDCTAPIGFIERDGDCDDLDDDVHPNADEEDCADPVDYNCDGYVGWYDGDGDHFPACEDCDDTRADVHEGAEERCNGADDDCDGETDEDLERFTWYPDDDEDGWGGTTATVETCTRPGDWVLDGTDCDDTDPDVHPAAPEPCNGADDDCDGVVDEDDADASTEWYADADADGFGDKDAVAASCTQPVGYVADDTDCDDADPLTNPDADEYCGGGDEDCDRVVDEDAAVDVVTWHYDADRDGYGGTSSTAVDCDAPLYYVATADDCDDADADEHPGGDEHCDGQDENCDGVADEDAVDRETWYEDGDGDGFGDAGSTQLACDAPVGWIADATDCDDADPAVYPEAPETDCADPVDYNCDGSSGPDDADADGWLACQDCADDDPARNPTATETCDGMDEDCDGEADEDDAADAAAWHPDSDGDTWGDAGTVVTSCEAPTGHVADGTDCDDTRSSVNPAATETCASASDDDCDGDTNEEDAASCLDWYLDADRDGFGGTSARCLCEGDGDWDAPDADDCDDASSAIHPAAAEVCGDALDNDCDGSAGGCGLPGVSDLADGAARIVGTNASDYLAASISGGDDVDGDGIDDLLLGMYGSDRSASAAGVALVFSGPLAADATATDATATLLGESAADYAGWAVAVLGDTDGDGFAEVAVGAYGDDDGGAGAGAVYVLGGPLSGDVDLATGAKRTGTDLDDCAGCALSPAGDTDGDDVPDLLVGAWRESVESGDAGAAYLFRGPVTGTASMSTADALLLGDSADDQAGWAVTGGGDWDGDGLADVAAGAPGDDGAGSGAGAAWLWLGPLSGTTTTAAAAWSATGESAGDLAGYALCLVGDTDGDGLDDLAVGAPGNDDGGSGAGAVYLVRGSASGATSLTAADATLIGETANDDAGIALTGADFDADGFADLVVGADANGRGGVGGAWYFAGPVSGSLDLSVADGILTGQDSSDSAGRTLASAGDNDGDGFVDLAVGAWREDSAASDAGALYLLAGGPGF